MGKIARYLLVAVFSTAAVLFGGGFAHAQLSDDLFSNTSDGSTANFGRCGANRDQIAQKFQAMGDTVLCFVQMRVAAQASPTDGVSVSLVEGDDPTGSTVASAALEDVDGTYTLRTATFDQCLTLPTNTTYWLVAYRNGACDDTNFYVANLAALGGFGWQGMQKVSGVWSNFSPSKAINSGFYGSHDVALFASYSSSTYGFTDPDFGIFGNAVIDALKWLFIPAPAALGVLASQREALMLKPPFVWASVASSTIGGLDTGDSTTSTAITWTASSTGVHQTISLFTPSDIADKIPNSVQTLVRAIGATLMWAMFFSWIVSLATSGHITDHVGIQTPELDAMNAGLDDMLTEIDEIEALHGASDEESYDTHEDL